MNLTTRLAPLAGVLCAGLTLAGDLTIGPFPDGSTPAGDLPGFYAAHGHGVAVGGTLLGWSAVCFALFAAALFGRLQAAAVPAVVAGVVLIGAAAETIADLDSAAVYRLLGDIGADPHVTSSALQAWHISGAEFGVSGTTTLFLLGVAVVGIGYRAVPRWLAWSALALAVAPVAPSPWSFYASLLSVLWVGVAGVALALRTEARALPAPAVPATSGR